MSASQILKSAAVSEGPLPMAEICAVSERLQRLAEPRKWNIDPASRHLLEELFALAAEAEQTVAEQKERIRYLESLSMTDELTGLLNRRGFDAEFARALARAGRFGEQGVLLLCDLDHFKSINDSYGHPAGDAVLRMVGAKLAKNTRRCDAVARIGGDEFAVLLTRVEPDMADGLSGKLNRLLNGLAVGWDGQQIPVSASCGWASYRANQPPERLMAEADRALYAAKNRLREALPPTGKVSRRKTGNRD